MKILAIMGSPRKGNSYKITKMLEEKMKSLDGVDFDYLFLKDAEVSKCSGCHTCIMRGEEKCPYNSDTLKIEKKMMDADGVIFVSPIYTYHITGLMKNFFDRSTYLVHRPRFFGKKAMVFVQRGDMFKESIAYVKRVAKSWGFEVTSTLGVPELESLTEKKKEECTEKINSAAEKFFLSFKNTSLPRPSLYDLVGFRIWKINAEVCRKDLIRDYEYWIQKGWFNKDYYYDVKIGLLRKKTADLVSSMVRGFMKKVFVGY